jgi:hypothetical protein
LTRAQRNATCGRIKWTKLRQLDRREGFST